MCLVLRGALHLSTEVHELQNKCNNQDQMRSLFEGERAKFVFSNVHFESNPYQRLPNGARLDLPTTAGYEPGVQLEIDNSGRMDAIYVTWRTSLTLSGYLDHAGEDALYAKTAKQKPVTDRDVLKGDKLFLRAALGRKLTIEDQTALNTLDDPKRKLFYVIMIGEYRDKMGVKISEFCGHYASSDLGAEIPCFKHNR